MKRWTLFGLLGIGLATAGCGGVYGGYYANTPPPPLQAESYGNTPQPGYVWVGGYWVWQGGRYAWVPGRWDRPPRGYHRWEAGRWENRGQRYQWREGHWRK
jgi:hypothetical protein